jgi:invasion protein IalB
MPEPLNITGQRRRACRNVKHICLDTMNGLNTPLTRRIILFALLAMLAAASAVVAGAHTPAQAQFSESELKTTVGAWQVRCGRPPGARAEKCALVQSVKAEDRRNVSLTIIFLRSFSGDKRLLRVVAPLGVLLPTGLGLKIDGEDVGHAPFLKCGQVGCVAEVVADDNLIGKMQSGQNAIFIIFQTPEEGIGVPIDLTGFGDGLAQLN